MPASLDDTFYPILLSRVEEPFTRTEAEAYFQEISALAERALRRGERYVVIVINDITNFSAAGRKTVADVQTRLLPPERNAVTLAALVPFDSAIVRGAVTALGWLSPQLATTIQAVSSMDAAVDEALRVLDANGTPFRGDLRALCQSLSLQSRPPAT